MLVHALTATPVVVGSVTVGLPTFTPIHALTAVNVATSAPAFSLIDFRERTGVYANDVEISAPVIGTPRAIEYPPPLHFVINLNGSATAPISLDGEASVFSITGAPTTAITLVGSATTLKLKGSSSTINVKAKLKENNTVATVLPIRFYTGENVPIRFRARYADGTPLTTGSVFFTLQLATPITKTLTYDSVDGEWKGEIMAEDTVDLDVAAMAEGEVEPTYMVTANTPDNRWSVQAKGL